MCGPAYVCMNCLGVEPAEDYNVLRCGVCSGVYGLFRCGAC